MLAATQEMRANPHARDVEGGMLTQQEAANLSRLSRPTLARLMAEGKLKYSVVGSKKLIFRSSLIALLTEKVYDVRSGQGE